MTNKLDKEKIYEENYQKVFAYVHSHITNYHDAQDLSEYGFVKVYKKLDDFDESKSSLSTWIYNITKNTVIDFYRTRHDQLELIDNYEYVEEDDPVSPTQLADLADALNKLDQEEKDIITLRYYKGYSLKEIAEMMSLSYGVTKLRHNSALKRLKELLSE